MFSIVLPLLAFAATAAIPDSIPVQLPSGPHPAAFLTQAEQAAARAHASEFDWARKIAGDLKKDGDALVNHDLDIPHAGGQWSHWYTCKKDGSRLNAETPTRHVCGECGEVYSGFPYDQVYFTSRHNAWLRGVETLGMAYAVTGEAAYAERVREILLEYASFYGDLPYQDKDGKDARHGARLFAQTLNSAVALCSVAFGYDLVHDAPCFSAQDHETIANDLIRPMVATIRRYPAGMSNWQSWHNGAIASAGFVLRDAAMVDFAINDPKNGFLYQLRESVLPSGMWYEGAPSYHWYALSAHVYLLESAARAGMDLYAIPTVRALFEGPTKPLFPDLTYPAINDSSRSSIKGANRFYEIAYQRYGGDNFLALSAPRNTPYALLWGEAEHHEPGNAPLTLETYNDKEGGLAVLRDNTREAALFFNYNPGTHGHIQPPKLDIILYANGDERIVDPGRLAYGNPMHKGWYRQAIAHNTVVVNTSTHERAPGQFRQFETGNGHALIRAAMDGAYDGVTLDRTVCLRDGVIIDVFLAKAEAASTFDLPLHFNGTLAGLPAGTSATLGDTNGYEYLREVHSLEEQAVAFSVDTGNGSAIHVSFLDRSAIFRGEGRAQPPQRFIPMVLRRQQGTSATFVTVYQILQSGDAPRPIDYDSGEGVQVGIGDAALRVTWDDVALLSGPTVQDNK